MALISKVPYGELMRAVYEEPAQREIEEEPVTYREGWEPVAFEEVWQRVSGCSYHPQAHIREEWLLDAETIVGMEEIPTMHAETNSFAIAKLADGRYIAAEEWGDTSGHGCQCAGTAQVYDTLEQALSLGLSDGNRDMAAERLAQQ